MTSNASYLQLDSEYEGGDVDLLRREVHRFAEEEMRPIAREMDQMPAEEYQQLAERPSIVWDYVEQSRELGYHRVGWPEEFGGIDMSTQEMVVMREELAWGDAGLSIMTGQAGIQYAAESEELFERIVIPFLEDTKGEYFGCWGVTEPQHGSDTIGHGTDKFEDPEADPSSPQATMEKDGDEYVINGQKSSWVSGAPLASHVALQVNMDPKGGEPGGSLVVVPLDADGVTKSDPLVKMGDRGNLQGEIFFNDVRLGEEYLIRDADTLKPGSGPQAYPLIFTRSSASLATSSVGLARAAFEEALEYAKNREQGGRPIVEHQSVQEKLYEMFEKVETARAYSRQVNEHVSESEEPSYRHSLAAQVYCNRIAFEVAHEAVEIHGANGITKDYHVEKLFRDTRVDLIKDGTIEVLALEAVGDVIDNYGGPGL